MAMPDSSDLIRCDLQLSQQDFDRFADLSGDDNPIHTDAEFAASTVFGATVSHGMLLFTRLRGVMAQHFPGAVLEQQALMFSSPAYAEEPLHLTLTPMSQDQHQVSLLADIRKPDGRSCLNGECRLRLPAAGEQP